MHLGLGPLREAAAALGNPQSSLPTIHVAGTNGKGSTCAFTAACLQEAGYRVGLYTAPYLVRVHETIQVSGGEITDAALAHRLLQILERWPAAGQPPYPLTFFELTTLVAFWHFVQEQVDVVVLETGLGGRLDATNIATSEVAVITPISADHMDFLGDSLTKIATEKAGIFKPGAKVVSSRQVPEVLEVLEQQARTLGLSLSLEGRDFQMDADGGRHTFRSRQGGTIADLNLGLRGRHQAQNAALALAALECGSLPVPVEAVHRGLTRVQWPGRLEEVSTEPSVVLDGAHNPAGIQTLLDALNDVYSGRRVHLVFAVLADKDRQVMLEKLLPRCASAQLTPLRNPRSLPPQAYEAVARTLCDDVAVHADVETALQAARQKARGDDVILCAGSLSLIGELKQLLSAT